jgi:hypothetical protein
VNRETIGRLSMKMDLRWLFLDYQLTKILKKKPINKSSQWVVNPDARSGMGPR